MLKNSLVIGALLGYLSAAQVNAIRTEQVESLNDDLYLAQSDIDIEPDTEFVELSAEDRHNLPGLTEKLY